MTKDEVPKAPRSRHRKASSPQPTRGPGGSVVSSPAGHGKKNLTQCKNKLLSDRQMRFPHRHGSRHWAKNLGRWVNPTPW